MKIFIFKVKNTLAIRSENRAKRCEILISQSDNFDYITMMNDLHHDGKICTCTYACICPWRRRDEELLEVKIKTKAKAEVNECLIIICILMREREKSLN